MSLRTQERKPSLALGEQTPVLLPRDTYDSAREAWPGVALEREALAAFVDLHADAVESREVRLRHTPPNVKDLFLACACLHGDPKANSYLESMVAQEASTVARCVAGPPDLAPEVRRQLRRQLLTPETGVPKLARYGGGSPLSRWIRMAALRLALSLRSSLGRPSGPKP
ncbi:MAG: hypothetical protein HY901_20015 [Deltaproteobacteria bacterium]|nr:hypothetical protein [Deltaproteobacteria bacterium]